MQKKRLLNTAKVTLLLLVLIGLIYSMTKNNIHTVIPKQVYRSAQLTPLQLENVIQRYKIRSIFNLRGAQPDENWYRAEKNVATQHHVQQIDLPMRAFQLPRRRQVQQLINRLQSAPKPLLIHCMGGADRTGFASAISLLLMGKNYQISRQQISPLYFSYRKDSVGRLVMPKYAAWLKKNNARSSKANFMQWVHETPLFKDK